ncbi:FMN-dependent dehydrogenase-domain-containing protein [Aspergillus pseudoustus]|uniref:FMN-dependent dehydrogenase-domain-containing protein n=1 Tax=Aspergillus pseudoustus TaxID=1810923 RepID=A0ABR4KR40_9EURO
MKSRNTITGNPAGSSFRAVYDVTEFLEEHPGGVTVILQHAGKVATAVYEALHPPGTIDQLSKDKHLGRVEPPDKEPRKVEEKPTPVAEATPTPQKTQIAHLRTLQNLTDFEPIAQQTLTPQAWAYYSTAAEDLHSYNRNLADWSKITFRPRVLRDVAGVSLRRTIMGHASSLPIFISPTAMARLGHPDGELCLARAAARHNIVYAISSYSSVSHADVAACHVQGKELLNSNNPPLRFGTGSLAFQLYLPLKKEQGGRALIAKAKSLGYRALIITVDTPVIGRREADDRVRAEREANLADSATTSWSAQTPTEPGTANPVLRGAHSSTLHWDDLTWIKDAWGEGSGPIILKGIQTAEDALRASMIAGVQAIYLSNHGGRQLDHAPSSISTLLEIRKFYPQVLDKVEVYLDGGVRRGTDVLKALCLGARGVGLGRPFLYALSGYGTEGVVRAVQMLSDEIETAMRLLGVVDLAELDPSLVNTAVLERDLVGKWNVDTKRRSDVKL